MDKIELNLNNLTDEERQQLMTLVKKGNKVNKAFQPKYSEEYWYIGDYNTICSNDWLGVTLDKTYYAVGNCYPTEETAEFAKQKQIVTTELQRFADKYNEFELDWKNVNQDKYFIDYSYVNHCLIFCKHWGLRENGVEFTSKEIAQQAVETIGKERIKKYYLGVEE